MFLETDSTVGKPEFKETSSRFLHSAIINSDSKAQVLYFVLRLRNVCKLKDSDDAQVLAAQQDLKDISKEMDFMQYYFQSYQFVRNYYFNRNRKIRALEVIQEMQKDAFEQNSEYGEWAAENNLATFYSTMGASRAARGHLRKAINKYLSTNEPTIRKQSLSPIYLDYSLTFSPDGDSARYYLQKAWETMIVPMDSVRCFRESAKQAAVRGNYQEYVRYRDLCLDSGYGLAIGKFTPMMFEIMDELYAGNYDRNARKASKLPPKEMQAVGCTAEVLGNHHVAEDVKDRALYIKESELSDLLEMNLAEMEARYENSKLSSDLAKKEHQVRRITTIVAILVIALLVSILTFLLFSIRNLRKTREKDEKMIAELTEANERARRSDEAKTRFVQNMSHEIRTPLNAIVGFSQLLSLPDGTFRPEEKDDFAKHIINNTKMLTMLLDDILNASAMDAGNYRITYEDGDCDFICHEAITSAEHRLQPGVELKYVPSFEGGHVFRTDSRRVQQVLINMLTNACKYTSKGEIRLGCSLDENPGEVTFYVEDNGPGVPPEAAESIFNRFTKLDEYVQGTGLGLSICREIAVKMGARIFLDTSYSPGARFVFVVPDAKEQMYKGSDIK